MIQPDKFYFKTSYLHQHAASASGVKVCAVDIGYGGVKCFTNDSRSCFPSLARPVKNTDFFGKSSPNDILYRDDKGDVWNVGNNAIRDISIHDTNDSESTLYSRERYDSEMFKVLFHVGMGLNLLNEPGIDKGENRPIYLQTGLPPAYLKSDKKELIRVLSGLHMYEIKIGNDNWKEFCFELPSTCINVMAQPMGSLYSASIDNECRQIPEAQDYFDSSILVFDPGFGTFDTYGIRARTLTSYESFDDLGMKDVYKRLADKIYELYEEVIPVHAIPKALIKGYVEVFNRQTVSTTNQPITELLEQCCRDVCMNAIMKIKVTYDYLREFRYLLITGGTGEAWRETIQEHFAGMKNLKIITGNQLAPLLPQIFSNVRGYYLYQTGLQRTKESQMTKK